MPERNSRQRLEELDRILGERDKAILASLMRCRFLLTGQVQRLHITDASTGTAALRATARELKKLKEQRLVSTLERRIGGVRAGSASFVWHLTESGERLLNLHDDGEHPRKRFLEPSSATLRHTLAVSECYVQLVEICRKDKHLTLTEAEFEPECWRPYEQDGRGVYLKPDLFARIRGDGYEDRYFIEVDLSTEAPTVVVGKCERYRAYYREGKEQKAHGMFPLTVWIVPDARRKELLRKNIRDSRPDGPRLFDVILPDELERLIRDGAEEKELC